MLDPTGAVIPEARIVVRHPATRAVREVVSDASGEYTVANLAPGNYRIVVEKDGFRRLDERGLTLEMDQTARLDFHLQVGQVSEVVEVQASVPLLNTESAMKGDVIVSREMADIPLDGRDFADLAYLVPGVGQKAQGGNGSNFAVNGARTDNTNFVVDGFNNQNPRGGTAQARPPLDAMMEFKMQTTGYSAEYGRLAGGTMNMVLKTGTNRLHGSLFEFLRNDLLRRAQVLRPGQNQAAPQPVRRGGRRPRLHPPPLRRPQPHLLPLQLGRLPAGHRQLEAGPDAHRARDAGRLFATRSTWMESPPCWWIPSAAALRAPAWPARSATAFPATASRPAAWTPSRGR